MIGKKHLQFHEIDSTNTYIKQNYKNMESGTIVQANHQTKGYGRMNRIWHDEIGKNLMFSLYLKVPLNEDITMLTQMAASSVYKTLKDNGINAYIKWPNDVLIGSKKVCGILLESIIDKEEAHIIIGIGLNVNNKLFQKEINTTATSMHLETGITFTKENVLITLITHLNNDFISYINHSHEYIDLVRENSYLIGKEVELQDQQKAHVVDIDSKGRLVVKIDNKLKTFIGSEVSLTNVYQNKE